MHIGATSTAGASHRRVPITDGKCPEHDDIASIHESLVSAPRGKACFVFNCQQGKGRTTIGMAMATLFLSSPVRSSCLPRRLPELLNCKFYDPCPWTGSCTFARWSVASSTARCVALLSPCQSPCSA